MRYYLFFCYVCLKFLVINDDNICSHDNKIDISFLAKSNKVALY